MTTNNTNIDNQFDKSIKSLRAVSLTGEEKGKMFKALLHYAESHEPVRQTRLEALLSFFKDLLPVKIK